MIAPLAPLLGLSVLVLIVSPAVRIPREGDPTVTPQTLTRPETAPRRTRGRRAARQSGSGARRVAELIKIADAGRTSVTAGCYLVASYPVDAPVDQVVAELARWAADPTVHPRHADGAWTWAIGEQLAIWHAGQVLALIGRAIDGVTVQRFDRGTEAPAGGSDVA